MNYYPPVISVISMGMNLQNVLAPKSKVNAHITRELLFFYYIINLQNQRHTLQSRCLPPGQYQPLAKALKLKVAQLNIIINHYAIMHD